jgi:hypothetical protein
MRKLTSDAMTLPTEVGFREPQREPGPGHYEKGAVMTSARSTAVRSPVKAGFTGLLCFS